MWNEYFPVDYVRTTNVISTTTTTTKILCLESINWLCACGFSLRIFELLKMSDGWWTFYTLNSNFLKSSESIYFAYSVNSIHNRQSPRKILLIHACSIMIHMQYINQKRNWMKPLKLNIVLIKSRKNMHLNQNCPLNQNQSILVGSSWKIFI